MNSREEDTTLLRIADRLEREGRPVAASLFRGDVYRRDPELVENWSRYYRDSSSAGQPPAPRSKQ